MIIVNLKGGLGNQMFQYACGRALSLRSHDPEFKLDISGLERANEVGDTYRPYALANFNIKATIADIKEAKKIKYPYGLISKGWRLFRTKIMRQNYVAFVPRILDLRGSIYLDGYFQTEKYFMDFEKEIREDLTSKSLSDTASDLMQKIKRDPSAISVHVRRGDYVGHKVLDNICTEEYYKKAIGEIVNSVDNPHFYVFSNDLHWPREHLNFPIGTEYVSSPNLKDDEDLILMSACKHNIIANSSFSWWGAWLNPNPDKIVIAPKKWAHGWYNNKIKLRNIIPTAWTKI